MTEAAHPANRGSDGNGNGHGADDPLAKRVAEGPRGGARTWYDVLEVAPDVSPADLKKAYDRALALVEGRSIGGYLMLDPLAAEGARADVEAAFSVLGDAERRRAYDAKLRESGEEPVSHTPVATSHTSSQSSQSSQPSQSSQSSQSSLPQSSSPPSSSSPSTTPPTTPSTTPPATVSDEDDARQAREMLAIDEQQKASQGASSVGSVSTPGGTGTSTSTSTGTSTSAGTSANAGASAEGSTRPTSTTSPPALKFTAPAEPSEEAPASPGRATPASIANPDPFIPTPMRRIVVAEAVDETMNVTLTMPPEAAMPGPRESVGTPIPSSSSSSAAGGLPESGEIAGALIRQLREARGLTLDDMAAATKIRKPYLRAIEEEDAPNLPARVYLRGFLTQIARMLKVDRARLADGYLLTAERISKSS